VSEFAPLPAIGGLLFPFVGNAGDLSILTLAEDRIVEDFQPALLDAPSGGTVVLEVRSAIAGGGVGLQQTILDGAFTPAGSASGGPLSLSSGTELFLRIVSQTAPSGGLSGNVVLNSIGFTPLIDQLLTSRTLVLNYAPACINLDATDTTLIDTLIAAVSDRMVRWIDRQINQTSINEFFKVNGVDAIDLIPPQEWPVANMVLKRNGTAVDATKFRIEDTRNLRRIATEVIRFWERGSYELTYDGGYAAVPGALSDAATFEVVRECYKIDKSLIGIQTLEPQTGDTRILEESGFLRSTIQAMSPFKRFS